MAKFKECPDCGYNQYPVFDRRDYYTVGDGKIINGNIRASCYRCGWGTCFHKNVKECAKEWNECKID